MPDGVVILVHRAPQGIDVALRGGLGQIAVALRRLNDVRVDVTGGLERFVRLVGDGNRPFTLPGLYVAGPAFAFGNFIIPIIPPECDFAGFEVNVLPRKPETSPRRAP